MTEHFTRNTVSAAVRNVYWIQRRYPGHTWEDWRKHGARIDAVREMREERDCWEGGMLLMKPRFRIVERGAPR